MHRKYSVLILFITLLLSLFLITEISAEETKVHIILFYSPQCGHCHEVMTNVLPPLEEHYGKTMQVVAVDTSQERGYAIYESAVAQYNPEMVGVPTLIIGDHILIGSQEIPQQLPGLIEQYLAEGGAPWPNLPGLEEEIEAQIPSESGPLSWQDRYMQDPTGSTLCVVVLIGLITSLVASARPYKWQMQVARQFNPWGFLVIALIGMIAAIYLSYVETTQSTAVCGPIGDCNTVQQSEFALLFGFLPMAVFGLLGYLAIIATFVYGQVGRNTLAKKAPAATFLLAVFGTLFSAFLTFLEPFVIGATCMWCLTSAISMGAMLILSAGPGWATLQGKSHKKRKT